MFNTGVGYAANETFMQYRIATLINLLPKNIIPYRDTIVFLNITDVSSTFNWTDVTNKVDSYYFSTYDMNCHTKCKFKKVSVLTFAESFPNNKR